MGSYLLAACDNIQKGHYISPKQLTNWLVTLFIMSHTCDKLFNSVTPNKSKSKQLANAVWGLFVAIYRCSQAVTALQSAIKGEPLNDSLDMTSNTLHTWQRWNWQPILLLEASSPFPNSCLHVCSLHFSPASCSCWKRGEGGTVFLCNRARAVRGCSVGTSSGQQETGRALWLLTRRDTAGKMLLVTHNFQLTTGMHWISWKLGSFSS